MPWADTETRNAAARQYHRDHPERDRDKQRHRVRAQQILRERYRPEYDKLLKQLSYEGVKGNRRYIEAYRILRERHPRAWANARAEARREMADG